MDLSLRQLEQAVSLRRQIDALERRFAGLVGGGVSWRRARYYQRGRENRRWR